MANRVVFINGGTGFIGRSICSAFIKLNADAAAPGDGDSFRIFVQSRKPEHHRHRAITFVSSYHELPVNLAPDIIINLAGAPIADCRWTEQRKKLLLDSRVETTRALFSAVEARRHKPAVVLNASAVGYYGFSNDGEKAETASAGKGFASELCQQWEQVATQFEQLGSRVCRMRIGVVLGWDGGAIKNLLPLYRLYLGGPIGHGNQWFSWIHICDLVRLFLAAMDDSRFSGPVNCTAPNPVQQKTFAATLAGVINRPVIMPTPGLALKLIYGQMAEELLIGGQKVLPEKALAYGFTFNHSDLKAALLDVVHQNPPIKNL